MRSINRSRDKPVYGLVILHSAKTRQQSRARCCRKIGRAELSSHITVNQHPNTGRESKYVFTSEIVGKYSAIPQSLQYVWHQQDIPGDISRTQQWKRFGLFTVQDILIDQVYEFSIRVV